MCEHLEKAKGALEHARELAPNMTGVGDLLEIARTQAEVSQAESLERIAACMEWHTGSVKRQQANAQVSTGPK